MSTHEETQITRHRSVLYIVTAVVLVIVGVIAVLMFMSARQSAQAEDKANELIQNLEDAGVEVAFTPEQIAKMFGEDGGAVCANPNDALSRAILFDRIANGAGGPGMRPIITDERYLQGQILIMEVYCPDEVEQFQQMVDDLETTNTGN